MAAGYSVVAPQTVQPNQPLILTDTQCPCGSGMVFKKSGGVFLLASNAPSGNRCLCGCRQIYKTDYEVDVHMNVEIPSGGTVDTIQFAISVDGVVDPASIMSATPAAVEEAANIGMSVIESVVSLCGCESIAVVNIGTQPIIVNNASLVFDYGGTRRVR